MACLAPALNARFCSDSDDVYSALMLLAAVRNVPYNCRSISSRPLASALRFLGIGVARVQRRRLLILSPGAAARNGARGGFGRGGFGRAGAGSRAGSVLAIGATGARDGGRPMPKPAARGRRGEICGPERAFAREGTVQSESQPVQST